MRVLLGVTGGIAAYKVAVVVRLLREAGHSVRVVPTASSLEFVGRATWEALSGHPAPSSTFDDVPSVQHVSLGQRADIVLVAPATADFLAQMAHGEARDLLGNSLLATTAPVVVAPAMHTEMWNHAATQANVATLRDRGVHVTEPASGRLTGPDSGVGRLPDPEHLVEALLAVAQSAGLPQAPDDASWGDLTGLRVLVSAGGTREPIDPVRFIGNRSSGHQGFALAEAARERGAAVTVVAANVELPAGEQIDRIDVETTAQLAEVMKAKAADADLVIMAAAVADFKPREELSQKIKKGGEAVLSLDLVPTEDILASLVAAKRPSQVIVGFAAETGDGAATVEELGSEKARRKGADLLVINSVGGGKGFGDVPNSVTVVDASGAVIGQAAGPKLRVAHAVLDMARAAMAGADASRTVS